MFQKWFTLLLSIAALTASSVAAATDHVWLLAGAGGEAKYTEEFNSSLESIYTSLIERHQYAAENIVLLGESETQSGKFAEEVTLDEVKAKWTELINKVDSSDTFLLVMMGHGQSDFVEPKFNLKGPDLGGKTLVAMMEALPCEDKKAILSFPCSGHFSELLAPIKGVSVIASCDGPRQIFHSVMHPFIVQALQDDWSDQDGDGNLTFYELFQFLSEEVDDYYTGQEFVQINNVSLEDNGDGRVTTFAEDMDAGDGERAKEQRICPAPGYVEEPKEEEVAKL
jgi:hypothetical protein